MPALIVNSQAKGAQLTIIPTPGHTKGHMVLLYKNHFTFSWIFPGHGQRIHLNEDEMHKQMLDLVARMKI